MDKFLDDDRLGPAIRQLTRGADARCAVAFWGEGAARALFGDARSPANVRIVCDVSMGGTNPSELKALSAPRNPNLRHLTGLHAKVYLSDQGVITGSANASANGIGFSSNATLVEAGTFHEPGGEAYEQAAEWFERIWARSSQVNAATLKLADEAWKLRQRASRGRLNRAPDPASLLDAVAADPDEFRGVGFVFTSGTSDRDQRDETAEAVIAKDDALEAPLMSKSYRKALANWSVGDVFSEWDSRDISAWPQRFVCAHLGAKGRVSYWFYERAHTAIIEGTRGMVLAKPPGTLRRDLGLRHGRETMAKIDKDRLLKIFDHLGDEGHQLYESGEKLSAILADLDLMG